jgi:hypothetical protein
MFIETNPASPAQQGTENVFLDANSTNQSSKAKLLVSVPKWSNAPVGTTGFSIEAAAFSNSSDIHQSPNWATGSTNLTSNGKQFVSDNGFTGMVDDPNQTSAVLFGGKALMAGGIMAVDIFGSTTMEWAGGAQQTANKDAKAISTAINEIPLRFSGYYGTAAGNDSEYLYDFGLVKCNNADCSQNERVSVVPNDSFNQDIHFWVGVAIDNGGGGFNINQAPERFRIDFSGKWHT